MKIGIDLGTTNSALAYIDEREAEDRDFPPLHIFETPQLVAAGRVEARRTLPSFLYLEEGQPVGVYAREQGALVPTRLVHSAKSWLSNPDVDRTAKILPWDSQETGRVLSPVEVSSRIIAKFREEWDKAKGTPLAEQEIVLTVPASFDEEARELTVMAARDAGLEKLTLLEEPAAAFYSWIANNLAASRKKLFDGQIVLVCDVGGGTSDFSLIRVSREGDMVNFTRTAVGKHLLLGGDNLDLTLAWLVESKLGVPLSIRQRSGLRRQCSAAKEKLLNDANLKSVEITVLGSGSSLIGKSLKTEILREEALELALEGFLPMSERGELPKEEKRSLFRELGLPTSPTRPSRATLTSSWSPRARRRTPFSSTAAFSSRRFCASAWPMSWATGTDAGRRSSRIAISIWRWRAARHTTPTRAPRAAVCWCAAACRARTTSGWASRARASFPRCAWCRGAPRKVRRWKSTTTRCNWWPTAPSLSACTALSRAPTTFSGRCWNSTLPMPACTCTRRCTR